MDQDSRGVPADRRAVVVIGTRPYDSRVPLGDWQLARAFSRLGHAVLYVDPPANPLRAASYRSFCRAEPQAGEPAVTRFRPVGLGGSRPWRLPRVVQVAVGLQLRLLLLLRHLADPLIITVAPERGRPYLLGRHTLLYWQKDRQWASASHPRPEWLRQRHAALLRGAHVSTGVSQKLVEDGNRAGVAVHLIPNGVDLLHFRQPRPEPVEFATTARPRILFVGAWGRRVDHELFQRLADARPDWTFVILGAARNMPTASHNVHFMGPRDYADLPAYLQHSDVGIVPYKADTFNEASAPLKVWEYLAAGLPVVVSSALWLPATTPVQYASTSQEWLTAIERALAGEPAGAAEASLREASWEAKARRALALAAQHRAGY